MRSISMLLLAAGCAASSRPADPAPTPVAVEVAPPPKTLFDRLGGLPAIEAVVAEFQSSVAADERINARFGIADLELLRHRLVSYFCQATGGPCRYDGRDMKAAHAGMGVTTAQFGALVEALTKSLTKCGVPPDLQGELLSKLAPLQPEIVEVD